MLLEKYPNTLVEIESLLHRLTKGQNDSAVNSLHKKKIGKEMRMNIQIGDYEVDLVILDVGSDVSIMTRNTWKMMGSPTLSCSPVQLRLANQAKVTPIGRVLHLAVEVEGMKAYANFDVIEVVDGGGSYPTLLGIGWANNSMEVINFKKRVMTFENQDIRVIALMDPNEGQRYIEPVKDEFVEGWDHAYNILGDYVHPTIDGELG